MRALITGVGGFVGRYLARHLMACGDEVSGLARYADSEGLDSSVRLFAADLCDQEAVREVLETARPDAIYHLAAQSSSSESLTGPWDTVSNNLGGQMNLLEAAVKLGTRPRVLVIGSSDEYGHVRPEDLPTREDVPLRPTSPYAVSKVGQDVMGYQYFAQYGLPVVRVRPFSHTGPGHDSRFVIPNFARQVARIEAGLQGTEMHVGNLDVYRDFTDVRDMVRAYRLALVAGMEGDVYNLGSGVSVAIRDALDTLITMCRVPVRVVVDPQLLRPSDVPRQLADTRKFRTLTNWQPDIPWETTLRDTLDAWREHVSRTAAQPHHS